MSHRRRVGATVPTVRPVGFLLAWVSVRRDSLGLLVRLCDRLAMCSHHIGVTSTLFRDSRNDGVRVFRHGQSFPSAVRRGREQREDTRKPAKPTFVPAGSLPPQRSAADSGHTVRPITPALMKPSYGRCMCEQYGRRAAVLNHTIAVDVPKREGLRLWILTICPQPVHNTPGNRRRVHHAWLSLPRAGRPGDSGFTDGTRHGPHGTVLLHSSLQSHSASLCRVSPGHGVTAR